MKFTYVEPEQARFEELKDGDVFQYKNNLYMRICGPNNGWGEKGYNSVRLHSPILEKLHANTVVIPLDCEMIYQRKPVNLSQSHRMTMD